MTTSEDGAVVPNHGRGSGRGPIIHESREVRHLIGRLGYGDDLLPVLVDICRTHGVTAGWVSAIGAFSAVALAEYDQTARRYRPAQVIEQATEILSLVGNVSLKDGEPTVHVHATVSCERELDGERYIDVVGGHVVSARVFACEIRVECFDDVILTRATDADTGLPLWRDDGHEAGGLPPRGPRQPEGRSERIDHTRAQSVAKAGAGGKQDGPSWAQVAMAAQAMEESRDRPAGAAVPSSRSPSDGGTLPFEGSMGRAERRTARKNRKLPPEPKEPAFVPPPLPVRNRPTEEDFFDEPIPVKGDWVDHKQFGLCRIDGEDAEGSLIIRLPSGVRKAIKLDYLRVEPARIDGDRRIFPLHPKRR